MTDDPCATTRLSRQQLGIWLLEELSDTRGVFHTGFTLRLTGPLDVDALRHALNALSARHDVLRTVVRETVVREAGQELVGVVLPATPVPLVVHDAHELGEQALVGAVNAAQLIPFDLRCGPLLRADLFHQGPDSFTLLVCCHHIACDGETLKLIRTELFALYLAAHTGTEPNLEPNPPQYRDYAEYQHEQLTTGQFARSVEYWRDHLAGAAERLEIPTDFPRPAARGYEADACRWDVDAELAARVAACCRAEGVTLFMLFHAALACLLGRLAGKDDVVLGTAMANRQEEDEQAFGLFTNLVPLRLRVAGGTTVCDLLRSARDEIVNAYEHQEAPLELLLAELSLSHEASHQQLFQTTVQVLDRGERLMWLDDVRAETVTDENPQRQQFDLAANLYPSGSGLSLELVYSTDLFTAATIDSLGRRLLRLVDAMTSAPDRPIGDIDLLTGAERHQVLVEWNDTAHDVPVTTVVDLFARQVQRSPHAIAVIFDGRELSYRELNSRANNLALRLRDHGVQPGQVVAIAMPRSVELVVALLGILKAGAAYLPIDPDYPVERVSFMLTDTQPAAGITTEHTRSVLPGSIVLDASGDDYETDFHTEIDPNSLAYAIYTSGSTGTPKAVGVPHSGLVNRLLWMQAEYQLIPTDRVVQKTPYGFDVSVWEFFWPLITGATLVVATPDGHRDPTYLVQLIRDHNITIAHFVPSMLAVFLEEPHAAKCTSLRLVVCSGEALPPDLRDRCLDTLAAELHNLYGPTEASIDVTFWNCREEQGSATVPIGRPIWNTQVYVLDDNYQPVPPGVAGRLFLAGAGLAHGYLNRPTLTAQRFLPNPYGPPGTRLYDTGDLARWHPDGYLEYHGRADNQVKIRGIRIELGEIETTLTTHPEITQAAVVVQGETGYQQLAAYLVFSGSPDRAARDARAHLARYLPEYLIPDTFTVLDTMPLSPNGKLDRKALPRPDRTGSRGRPPRSFDEEALAELFAQALDVERVDVSDSFFALGGHSLLVTRLVSRIRTVLGADVAVRTLFEAPSVAALATRLREGEPPRGLLEPLVLNANGTRPPLFCVAPWVGISWCYATLVRALPADQPVYGLQSRGLDDVRTMPGSVAEAAEHHVAEIRSIQPHGPYLLLGWSFGGVVAHAVATRLQQRGEEVRLLAMLDSHPRDADYRPPTQAEYQEALLAYSKLDHDLVADEAELVDVLGEPGSAFAALDAGQRANIVAVSRNNLRIDAGHRAEVFHGDVLLFTAERTHDGTEVARTWESYVDGKVKVIPLDYAHGDLTEPGAAALVGAALTEELSE
jgi:amino acid adenylation domain-containing protein